MTLSRFLGGAMFPLCLGVAMAAEAKTRIVVLAEDYPQETAQAIGAALAKVFDGVSAGDRLLGIRGGSGETIFEAIVPDDPIYDRHKGHRDKLLGPAWRDAMSHLQKSVQQSGSGPVGAPGSQVDFPGTLGALAYHASEEPEVVVFGDPRYFDERQPDFAMTKGFPTEGHYALSRTTTPFGIAGLEGSLKGVDIHFCATSDEWVNNAHKEGVLRTYAILTAGYGATLSTFSADLTGCAARFAKGQADGARVFERDPQDHRFGMIDATLTAVAPDPVPTAAGAVGTGSAALDAAIKLGTVQMHSLVLYDTDDEDGDAVEIVADGFSKRIVLTKRGETLEVPITLGALQVIGSADGGGGITVGIQTSDGRTIVSDKIAVGQSLAIPVAAF